MVVNRKFTPTLTSIARKSGISMAHISKIFGGTRTPSLRLAARIAVAKGVSLDELYRELVAIQRAA